MTLRIENQRGVAAVEMAVVLIPMLLLCFAVSELGRALYQYDGLVKSTRGAARFFSQQSVLSPPPGETADSLRLKARSLVLCGAPACADRPALVPGLALEMISVCDPLLCPATHLNVPTGEGAVNLVTVVIGADTGDGAAKFTFTSAVPWAIPDITFNPIGLTMASAIN